MIIFIEVGTGGGTPYVPPSQPITINLSASGYTPPSQPITINLSEGA